MKNQDDARNLLERVLEQAREEAARLAAEAKEYAARREEQTSRQIDAETAETESRLTEEKEKILRRYRSALLVERRRLRQQLREKLLAELETECYRHIEKGFGDPAWQEVLVNWIVEGAVAIDREEGRVNASAAERKLIDRKLLDRAGEKFRALTGRTISLELSTAQPLAEGGLVVESSDGRLSYSNTLKTRYHRRQTKIREMLTREFIEPLLSAQGDFHE